VKTAFGITSCIAFVLLFSRAPAQTVKRIDPSQSLQEELGIVIPMRDGVHLAADVFRPPGNGRWPALLVRTPYNRKASSMTGYRSFARLGYAVVVEDVRGRFASEGVAGPIEQEGPDGSDTISWIAEQPWSNSFVGMVGASYLGIVQWWAAIEDNPHLVTIAPVNSGDDEYLDRFYSTGGAMKLGHRLLWLAENFTPPAKVRPQFGTYIFHLPLRSADLAAIGTVSPIWRDAMAHPSYDAHWKALSIRENIGRVEIPVLSMSGWFDNYAPSELDAFTRLSQRGQPVETWIGPWSHVPGLKFPTRDFGVEADLHIHTIQEQWFDRWLKKRSGTRPREESDLHLFVMGTNVWRAEREWPLARTRYTPLYLSGKGHANAVNGDGVLTWQPVRDAATDSFTYDPKNPVPTIGGAICCDPKVLPPGPLDQTPVERRPDVLVYTSPSLTEDVEVTGPVSALLYVSTSANDTDFTVKLIDVQPDGRPLLVCDGIQRLRYRMSLDKPVFVKRNGKYQVKVDVGVTSYVFLPGHKFRLEVSSSNFPRFDRNLNSVRPNADETKMSKARQSVYHEKNYPSCIILPVIPRLGVVKNPS
jgi:putative CocE/NonD family hydrolase